MTNLKIVLSLLFVLLTISPLPVLAQEAEDIENACIQINNGGDTCFQSDVLTLNKEVLHPSVNVNNGRELTFDDFIENTGLEAPFTSANSLTAFRLSLTNITNHDLKNITVVDRLPSQYLTYVTSEGTYDEQKRQITFTIDSLSEGQTQTFIIQVMTAMGTLLPSDPVCVTNQANARVTNERFFILPDEVKESQDNARLCITKNEQGGTPLPNQTNQNQTNSLTTKGGLPVMAQNQVDQTPETGAEAVALAALLPAGALGYFLRRKAK